MPKAPQKQPGVQSKMRPKPKSEKSTYHGSGKLRNKVAIITGGDSGIGRAVALAFAKEGADSVIVYLSEHQDAEETKRLVEKQGRKCALMAGDIGNETFCQEVIEKTLKSFARLDILINNAGEQHSQENFQDITAEQLQQTYRTNIFAMFYLTKAALMYMKKGSAIVNTTSVTAYRGSEHLIDYSSTKGAIVSFTRSLSANLAKKGIRINAVAPGPIWTPLIVSTFPKNKIKNFGKDVPMGRPGQPDEVAPAFVFLASDDSSYITGQVIHVNGGEIING